MIAQVTLRCVAAAALRIHDYSVRTSPLWSIVTDVNAPLRNSAMAPGQLTSMLFELGVEEEGAPPPPEGAQETPHGGAEGTSAAAHHAGAEWPLGRGGEGAAEGPHEAAARGSGPLFELRVEFSVLEEPAPSPASTSSAPATFFFTYAVPAHALPSVWYEVEAACGEEACTVTVVIEGDAALWMLCGRRRRAMALEPGETRRLQCRIIPLVPGHLPLPTVSLRPRAPPGAPVPGTAPGATSAPRPDDFVVLESPAHHVRVLPPPLLAAPAAPVPPPLAV
eukprot:tig00020961_g16748.t1